MVEMFKSSACLSVSRGDVVTSPLLVNVWLHLWQVWIRGRVHQVRGKGGSAFLVVRQDTASTVQAVHFKDKENVEDSKRWVRGFGRRPDHCCFGHGPVLFMKMCAWDGGVAR